MDFKQIKILLCFYVIALLTASTVLAQVREDAEVLVAPALEVFSGKGTSDEIYYVSIIMVGASLLAAIIAANLAVVLKQFTLKLLIKIFAVWLVFTAGVSVVALSVYVGTRSTEPVLRADEESQPRNITVRVTWRSLIVIWKTAKPTVGQLRYTSNIVKEPQTLFSNNLQVAKEHQIEVLIKPDEHEYFMAIFSDGVEYRLDGELLHLEL